MEQDIWLKRWNTLKNHINSELTTGAAKYDNHELGVLDQVLAAMNFIENIEEENGCRKK